MTQINSATAAELKSPRASALAQPADADKEKLFRHYYNKTSAHPEKADDGSGSQFQEKNLPVLDRLNQYWPDLSTRDGKKGLTKEDLEAIVKDVEGTSEESRAAAKQLLDNPELFKKLDRNGDGSISDNEFASNMLPRLEAQARDAANGSTNKQWANNSLDNLINSDTYKSMEPVEKAAVLSAAKNFGDSPAALRNLDRLMDKEWFQDMSLEDKQRTMLAVGSASSDPNGDPKLIEATLNKFLHPDSNYKIAWESLPDGALGRVSSENPNTVVLNKDMFDASNSGLTSDSQVEQAGRLFTETLAHEANHIINNDVKTSNSGSEFLAKELRAWRVGFQADNGRPPTQNEMATRISDMLGLGGQEALAPFALEQFVIDPAQREEMMDLIRAYTGREDLSVQDIVDVSPENPLRGGEPGAASSDAPPPANGGPHNLDNKHRNFA